MAGDSATLLAAIVEASNDAIVSTTLHGIVTSWNPAAERIFGYEAAEMLGRTVSTLFPPEQRDEEERLMRRIARGERVATYDTGRIRKDGSLIEVSVTLSPLRDAAGAIVGVSRIARDISGQRAAAARLHAHERMLAVTLASIGDAVIATDMQACVTFMNQEAERLTAWPAALAIGRRLEDVFRIVNEKTRQPVENPVTRAIREGAIVGLANHTVLLARDGRSRPIDDSAAPIQDDRGRVLGAVLVFRDISERRRSEAAQQRLAAIVESSDDAIVSKTLDGVITSWNRGAEAVFGYSEAEAVGRSITFLFPPDRLSEEKHFLAQIAAGNRVDHFETVRIRKDGRPVHISVTLSPIRDATGEIVGVSKIARDITRQVESAERERAARREAEDANRLKDEFLAMLSHELRTPLNSILGWTRIMKLQPDDRAMTGRALDVIERSCQTQLGLITDLLDVSRITSGQVVLDLAPVAVDEVVRAAADGVRPSAAAKGLTLVVVAAAHLPSVHGDAERLQQVIWNLLTNAVKFTSPGGRVTILVAPGESTVEISVSDTGVGIPADVLPHVFDRFRQADSSRTRAFGGLGLGLAIARGLTELHGGRIRADSAGEGRGTTMTVSLPVLTTPAARAAATPAAPPAPQRLPEMLTGSRVLVVDDDPDSRDVAATVLAQAGAAVVLAASAQEAVALLREHRPDVLIADVGMPGEDGFTLVKRIRQLGDPGLARTRTLALTAYARASDRQLAQSAGFDAFLAKPVDPFELVRRVAVLRTDGPA